LTKLAVADRAQAVVRAREAGLGTDPPTMTQPDPGCQELVRMTSRWVARVIAT
jgi:hypothetical protein